jgi:hypothetical protein
MEVRMEKLSHIIKSNAKDKVDFSKERPVRTGAPGFGQPVSHVTHSYESPEQEMADAAKLERQKQIVDRVNFSFKKPETPEMDREELQGMKTQNALAVQAPVVVQQAEATEPVAPVEPQASQEQTEQKGLSLYA